MMNGEGGTGLPEGETKMTVLTWREDYPDYAERMAAMSAWIADGHADAMIELNELALVPME